MTMKHFPFERLYGRVLVVLTASLVSLQPAALGQSASGTGAGAGATDLHRAMDSVSPRQARRIQTNRSPPPSGPQQFWVTVLKGSERASALELPQ
jgi:hypothetical protein